MPASLPFRIARATVFAVVCVGLSVTVHLFAGGSVSAPSAAVGLALAFAMASAAAGRERSPAVILPLLTCLQAVLHVLFSLAHAPSPAMAAEHVHSGLVPGLGMLIMHGWAVGLTGLWLARGESVLWTVVRRLLVRLRRVLLVVAVPEGPPFLAVSAAEPDAPRSAVLRHAVHRRGPPWLVTATSG
ncbi:MFS transporter [Streptosporangium sp. KLBMP 9127]|nr:MFS transporter [Streptosporangium sp. KLBMP 9127]